MQAVVFDDEFRLSEVPSPTPGPGEVAIRVSYAAVQYGDVLVRAGHFPVARPFVPGFEAAGEIIAVGAGVSAARVGSWVTALLTGGGFAEVVTAPATLAIDAGAVDPRTAAAFGWTTPTAYDLTRTIEPGDRVLIHAAAGGVGSMAVQFARSAGAARVVGVVGDPAKAAVARGYDRVLTRNDPLDEDFDVILDPVGGETRLASLARLAPHGRLVAYGNIATFDPVTVSANDLLMRGQSLITYNSSLAAQTHPSRLARSAARALTLVADGTVHIDITAEHPLSDVEKAIAALAAGHTTGKTLIRIRASTMS